MQRSSTRSGLRALASGWALAAAVAASSVPAISRADDPYKVDPANATDRVDATASARQPQGTDVKAMAEPKGGSGRSSTDEAARQRAAREARLEQENHDRWVWEISHSP